MELPSVLTGLLEPGPEQWCFIPSFIGQNRQTWDYGLLQLTRLPFYGITCQNPTASDYHQLKYTQRQDFLLNIICREGMFGVHFPVLLVCLSIGFSGGICKFTFCRCVLCLGRIGGPKVGHIGGTSRKGTGNKKVSSWPPCNSFFFENSLFHRVRCFLLALHALHRLVNAKPILHGPLVRASIWSPCSLLY